MYWYIHGWTDLLIDGLDLLMDGLIYFSSSGPSSVTPERVHYWVAEVHPITAAIRSLNSVLLKFIVCWVFLLSVDPVPPKSEVQPSSALFLSAPLDPLAPWDSSSPLPPVAPSGSSSVSKSASVSVSAAADAAFSRATFSYIPVCSHDRRDTCAPGRRVAFSHRSRIGRVVMNCATVFCLWRIEVLIPTIPVSFIIPANGGYIQLLSFLCRGCLPVIFLVTLDWKLSRAFSIRDVNTHVSDQKSKTA